jgi:hypothetical protein
MEVKCLEIRDAGTFIPVICIRPVAENNAQRYLLRRDGYHAGTTERLIIMIDAQCRGVSFHPLGWKGAARTKPEAHRYIEKNWYTLADGDVIDVQYILKETAAPKISEGAAP